MTLWTVSAFTVQMSMYYLCKQHRSVITQGSWMRWTLIYLFPLPPFFKCNKYFLCSPFLSPFPKCFCVLEKVSNPLTPPPLKSSLFISQCTQAGREEIRNSKCISHPTWNFVVLDIRGFPFAPHLFLFQNLSGLQMAELYSTPTLCPKEPLFAS